MDKNLLDKYKKSEDKLLLAKIIDKCKFSNDKNRVIATDFLDLAQKKLVIDFLKGQKEVNYIVTGGFEEAERTVIIFYPDKLDEIIKENKFDLNTQLSAIRINLPNELNGEYSHKNYLGALMKLGLKREKIGDIIVDDLGADIIVKPDIVKFLMINLSSLTRFSKSEIKQIDLEELRKPKINIEQIKITVSSMRLDNIVAEIAKCSRSMANELIEEERVFINFEMVTKVTKEVKLGDLITIRGKGRTKIIQEDRQTKNGRIVLVIEKYK